MLVPEPLEENIFNMVNDLLDFKKEKRTFMIET